MPAAAPAPIERTWAARREQMARFFAKLSESERQRWVRLIEMQAMQANKSVACGGNGEGK